jgi:translation elongation factor EF-Tu-like GTPase
MTLHAAFLRVEDVFTDSNGDLVVTGRVASGTVSQGDRINVLGAGHAQQTVVRQTLTGICHYGPAATGQNVALVIDPATVLPGFAVYRD